MAKRVLKVLDKDKTECSQGFFDQQVYSECADVSQRMRKMGVALVHEFFGQREIASIAAGQEGLVLTLFDDTKKAVDLTVNALGEVSVRREGILLSGFETNATSIVKTVNKVFEERKEVIAKPASVLPLQNKSDQLANEIASHLSNDVSGLTAKLGLKPIDYSVEIVQSGLMLVFCDKRGRSISATVCCDGSLKVSIQGNKEEHESPDIGLAIPYLKKLLYGDQEEKEEPKSEEYKRRFEHGVHGHAPPDDEETPQKSPKIQEEETEESSTQLVVLD